MVITGIEVIRGNATAPGNPAVLGVPAGQKLPVIVGDTVRVHMIVDHRGPGADGAIWTAIGWDTGFPFGFIEPFSSNTPVQFNDDDDFVTYQIDCDVPITDITGYFIEFGLYGNILDMRAKIMGVPGPDIFTDCKGAIEVAVEVSPQVELIQHTIYHFAYIYEGDVESTTATFKTDPFTPSGWMADMFASKLEEKVRAGGGRPLEVKVYVDTSPLLWTNFKIEVISTPLGGVAKAGQGIAVGIPLWAGILIAALAIIAVLVVATLVIKTIIELFKRKPGLEDMKPTWGKEALILDIQDSEEYWERTPTPVGTLEGMSEAELRDKLDQIAEEEVPTVPEFSWPLVILGSLGILGVGAAVALAARPKE